MVGKKGARGGKYRDFVRGERLFSQRYTDLFSEGKKTVKMPPSS
jgi:hypothetical protein